MRQRVDLRRLTGVAPRREGPEEVLRARPGFAPSDETVEAVDDVEPGERAVAAEAFGGEVGGTERPGALEDPLGREP